MDTNWKGEKGILNGKGKRDTKRKGKKECYTERGKWIQTGKGKRIHTGKGKPNERTNENKTKREKN